MTDLAEVQAIDPQALCQSQALAIGDIQPSPTNPRKTFPEDAHAEMVKSVRQHGVMSPILVRPWPAHYQSEGLQPMYELVAGERRYRAAKDAGLAYVPGLVRNLTDHETIELQIIENLHRKDLNELEEAEGYELATKQYGYTADQLAEKIDKSKAYIYARLKLTAACPAARAAFREGALDASRLLLIARIPTRKLQERALEEITKQHWLHTYRAAADHIQGKYMLRLAEAPFSRADADLVPAAGKCHPCPKRTGSNPELYPDVKSADICTDPECYADKKAAHFLRQKAEAKARGQAVIVGAEAKRLMPYSHSDVRGFVKLDDKCYDAGIQPKDGKYPTYRELLAEKNLPVTLIENQDGSLVELVKEADYKAVAADVGVKPKKNSHDAERAKRLAAEQEENEFRKRLFALVRARFQEDITENGHQLEQEDLQLFARQFLAASWHDRQARLAKLWVESEEKLSDSDRIHRLAEMIDTMAPAQLVLLLVDLSLVGMMHVESYQVTTTPEPLLFTARRLGIAPDTLRSEIKAEKAAKTRKTPTAKPIPTPSKLAPAGEGKSAEQGLEAKGEEVKKEEPAAADTKADEKSSTASKAAPAVARKTSGAEVLYRHPNNPGLTWSGRGRQPRWVQAFLEKKEGTLQDLLAKKRPAHKPKPGKFVTDETPIATEAPTHREDNLVLPGLDIETNETPTAAATPAANSTNQEARQGE